MIIPAAAKSEDTVRLATALRPALASRYCPQGDLRGSRLGVRRCVVACAKVAPGSFDFLSDRKAGSKIERFFRTVRDQFLVEITSGPTSSGATRHRPRGAKPAVRSLSGHPPWAGAFRDRADPAGAGAGGPVPLPAPETHRGVPVGGAPPRDQDRDRVAARQTTRSMTLSGAR
jgi:putative transposase